MNRFVAVRLAFVAACMLGTFAAGAALAQNAAQGRVHGYDFGDLARGGLLIKFKEGIAPAQAQAHLAAHGISRSRRFPVPRTVPNAAIGRWWHVALGPGQHADGTVQRLLGAGLIERIEPNFGIEVRRAPNDSLFASQWGLNTIQAPAGWDVQTGSIDVIVAVIDTGIDYNHPDLAANIWTNAGEVPGNGIDDDRNAYVDDFYGPDYIGSFNDPVDDAGHGSHVAGIIGAVGDNGVGVAGVNWRVRLMSLKVLNSSGQGAISDAVRAVVYAVDKGARVINASWTADGYSQALADAIAAANDAGALFVAAAGNESANNDATPRYPSGFLLPNVIGVAATTQSDELASFSNYGPTTVLLGAPGVGVLSTVTTTGNVCCSDPSGYKALDGTSMATPHVAGAAALLFAQNPSRTPEQVRRLLSYSSDPVAGLANRVAGGRLNVASALNCVGGPAVLRVIAPTEGFKAYLQTTTRIIADLGSCDAAVTGATVTVSFSNGEPPLTLHDDGAHGDGAPADGVYAADWNPSLEGPVMLSIAASGAAAARVVSGAVRNVTSYRYQAAPFAWIDATVGTGYVFTSTSTVSTAVTIPIGFPFNFYGADRDSLTISLNGYVTFDAQPMNALFWLMKPMPNPFPPNDVIAPYGDNFRTGPDPVVFTLLDGGAPNRRLTIAWVNAKLTWTLQPGTFELTLYEGSNDIVFQYLDTTFGDPSYDHGAHAAIGTEDVDAFEATQYPGPVLENTALRFFQTPYNYAPVANPGGPYTGIVKQPITFDGSRSSDRNADALTYAWNFGGFELPNTGTGVAPTYTYRTKGRYTVTLIVSDGVRTSAPVTTTVDIPNHAPVANAGGPYSALSNTYVAFDGSRSSDIDGDPLTFQWTVTDAAGKTYPTTGTGYPPGNYLVTLVVSDGTSSSAPSSTTMAIANRPPVVNLGPDVIYARGQTVTLGSSASDADGTIAVYAWRQVSGDPIVLTDTTKPTLTFSIAKNFRPGDVVFELKVTDNLGASASDQIKVTVTR